MGRLAYLRNSITFYPYELDYSLAFRAFFVGACDQRYVAYGTDCYVALAGILPCGPLHRIQADTVPGNYRSEELLRKLGFKEEGLRRDAGYWKGRYHS